MFMFTTSTKCPEHENNNALQIRGQILPCCTNGSKCKEAFMEDLLIQNRILRRKVASLTQKQTTPEESWKTWKGKWISDSSSWSKPSEEPSDWETEVETEVVETQLEKSDDQNKPTDVSTSERSSTWRTVIQNPPVRAGWGSGPVVDNSSSWTSGSVSSSPPSWTSIPVSSSPSWTSGPIQGTKVMNIPPAKPGCWGFISKNPIKRDSNWGSVVEQTTEESNKKRKTMIYKP